MKIDLGFCWFFSEDYTPEEGVPQLREYGFEGIELWPQPLERFGVDRWAKALRDNEMRCLQLCPYFNFIAGEAKLQESRRMLAQYIDAAVILGCRRIRVFTGPPWGEGVVGAKEASEAQWQAAIDGLQEFCDSAAGHGIEMCLECHEGSLMEDSVSALRLLNGVNRPNLTANLQLPLLNEDWKTSVDALGAYTTHIHIHNWTLGLGLGDMTFLGEGVFDWIPAVEALRQKGAKSLCLSVEHPNHGGGTDPLETAKRDGITLRNWKTVLQDRKDIK